MFLLFLLEIKSDGTFTTNCEHFDSPSMLVTANEIYQENLNENKVAVCKELCDVVEHTVLNVKKAYKLFRFSFQENENCDQFNNMLRQNIVEEIRSFVIIKKGFTYYKSFITGTVDLYYEDWIGNIPSLIYHIEKFITKYLVVDYDCFFDDVFNKFICGSDEFDLGVCEDNKYAVLCCYVLKRLLTLHIKECYIDYKYLNTFIINHDLLTKNISGCYKKDSKDSKFIFFEIVSDFVNGLEDKENLNEIYAVEKNMFLKNFIRSLHKIVTSVSELEFLNEFTVKYELKPINADETLFNNFIVRILDKYKIRKSKMNKDLSKHAKRFKRTESLALDIRNLTEDQEILVSQIINEDEECSNVMYVHKKIPYESQLLKVLSFLGMNCNNRRLICPITQRVMAVPFSYPGKDCDTDRLGIIYFWLRSLLASPFDTSKNWMFKHFISNEIVDIRNFIVNTNSLKLIDQYTKRIGPFKKYLPFPLEDRMKCDDLHKAIMFAIDSYFIGESHKQLIDRYQFLLDKELEYDYLLESSESEQHRTINPEDDANKSTRHLQNTNNTINGNNRKRKQDDLDDDFGTSDSNNLNTNSSAHQGQLVMNETNRVICGKRKYGYQKDQAEMLSEAYSRLMTN